MTLGNVLRFADLRNSDCPNLPPCEHGMVFHDIDELESPVPRCALCDCGRAPLKAP